MNKKNYKGRDLYVVNMFYINTHVSTLYSECRVTVY